jgi:succinate dehydrogenase / fumarate reductase membrane anchor subunit
LKKSGIETFWWSYMRISGLLIIPLVFGHLAMMHVIQGVFDITLRDGVAVGAVTQIVGVNETGTAVEFVYDRWNTLVAGVAVWRLYDAGMLALVVLHGFNGLRYVLTDYAHNPTLHRAMVYFCIIGAVVLIVLGGAALLVGVNDQSVALAAQAMENLHQ